jgi:hypothetical protein
MRTVADLTPAERAAEIAWRKEVEPISRAYTDEKSLSYADKQSAAIAKLAEEQATDLRALRDAASANQQREDVRAVMAAAAAIAVDVTSSLDMQATLEARDKKAVERAHAMWLHVNRLMPRL